MTPNVKQRSAVQEKKSTVAKAQLNSGRKTADKNVNERNNQLLQKDETGH